MWRSFPILASLVVLVAATAAHAQLPPADAAATLKLPDGLAAALFAAEPLLSSPSDIDVDARGRVWVCEVVNYRGKKNTRPEGDRILVLEDTDRDGQADKETVFYQGRDIDSALGICVIGDGPGRKAIISCAPEVFVLHDDDGDLVADRKEVLFTKTGQPQHDHSVHAFVVGPDGRWYFNFGNTGKAVHDAAGEPVRDRFGNVVNDAGTPYRQGMVFRCRPDGSDFEVLGHNFRNNYEVAVDSFGGMWQSDNDDDGNRGVRINAVLDYGNYGYVDERTGAGWQSPRTNLEAEVPLQHWHQNDPGVVPNLLLTGAGSPTGICVYEGTLLPARFHGSLIHCDAGPNVVRAYHVKPDRAGYTAESETLIDGSADRWFRPADVCVAPDGSLIVADWYDPGVGGHGMADTEKGRIFRIAPVGGDWSVPPVDFGTVAGAVAALASPNLSTRATALERLAIEPDAAHGQLEQAFSQATDRRLRARLAWAAGMLPGRAEAWVARLATDPDEQLRIVALRMQRLVGGDVLGLVERLVADPAAAVRREAALALRGITGGRADRAWAALAAQHTAGDRWNVEALGIGADAVTGCGSPGAWDGRLAAWREAVGDGWLAPAGREIVWRSRATDSPRLLCTLIGSESVSTTESLALVRALDFQDRAATAAAVCDLAKTFAAPEEKLRVILPELALRLDGRDVADARLAQRIEEAVSYVAGTSIFVDLVRRHRLDQRIGDLVTLAAAEGTADQLAMVAVAAALEAGAADVVQVRAAADPAVAVRLLAAVGRHGSKQGRELLATIMRDPATAAECAAAAVRGLARSQPGAQDLVAAASAKDLPPSLASVAALAVTDCPWGDVKQAAAGVLPMPQAKGGTPLPAVAELVKRSGKPEAGQAVFAGAGTCAKCHVVNGAGRAVGPDLSGIGAKLSRPALYEAILAPSAAISHNYETWTAQREDGRSTTGLLVSKSDAELVIRGADGIDVAIPANEIEELVKQPVSLMPADLAATLSAEELVDLVAWLETLRTTQ